MNLWLINQVGKAYLKVIYCSVPYFEDCLVEGFHKNCKRKVGNDDQSYQSDYGSKVRKVPLSAFVEDSCTIFAHGHKIYQLFTFPFSWWQSLILFGLRPSILAYIFLLILFAIFFFMIVSFSLGRVPLKFLFIFLIF